jgi:hypothetical protein
MDKIRGQQESIVCQGDCRNLKILRAYANLLSAKTAAVE